MDLHECYDTFIWIMLAPSEQTCRPDACKRLRLCSPNVMPFFSSIFFAKCTAKSLTVKGFPIRTFIIIATTRWNLNHLFDWHKRNNNKILKTWSAVSAFYARTPDSFIRKNARVTTATTTRHVRWAIKVFQAFEYFWISYRNVKRCEERRASMSLIQIFYSKN